MPTPVIIDGFDHQVASATFWGAAATGLWGQISNAGAISFDTTNTRTGAASLRVSEDGVTATNAAKAIPAGNRIIVVSLYVRVVSAPSVSSRLLVVAGPASTPQLRVDPDGTIAAWAGAGTAQTGPYIADGTWHLIDARVDVSTSTFTIDWRVDGVAQTQASGTGLTAADITYLRLGSGAAADTLTAWFDDLVVSFTSADYPLGPHAVRFLVPNADGVHNNAANIMERASDGADIDGTTVTAWNLLDEWPPTTGVNSADTVTQAGNGGTNYVEVQFQDIADSTVWGVEALAALQSDGTTANNGQTRIRDANGTETTVYSGDMSDTSPRYQRVIVTVPTGGWTQSAVNALRARIGYSSDAAPDPEWLALALQVAVAEASGPVDVTVAATVADAVGDGAPPGVFAGVSSAVASIQADGAADAPPGALSLGVGIIAVTVDGATDAPPAIVATSVTATTVVPDAGADAPTPAVLTGVDAVVSAVATDAAVDTPGASVTSTALAVAPLPDAVGDAAPSSISAGAVVPGICADAATDAPTGTSQGSSVAHAGSSDAVGDGPPAVVSTSLAIIVVPSDGSGDSVPLSVSTAVTAIAPAADGSADALAAPVVFGPLLVTTVADAGADVMVVVAQAELESRAGRATVSDGPVCRAAPSVSTPVMARLIDRALHTAVVGDERAV